MLVLLSYLVTSRDCEEALNLFMFGSLTFCSAKQLTAKHSFSWAGNFMSTPLHSQCLLYVHVYVLVNSVALTYPWGSCTFLFLNFYSSSLKSYFLSFNSCFSTSIQDSSLKSYFLSFRSCFLFLNFYSSSLKSYFLWFRSSFLFLNFYLFGFGSYFPCIVLLKSDRLLISVHCVCH